MTFIQRLAVIVIAGLGVGASDCSSPVVKPDSMSVYAIDANDTTVIIQGCGSQPVVGYAYCRKREGATTNEGLTVMAPPVDCGRPECSIQVEILFPDGSPSVTKLIPKGQTRAVFSWREILKSATFERNFRGFWPVLMSWTWIGPDEREHETVIEGEIRLRVYASGYAPLNEVKEDSNFVWKWADVEKNQYRMTTSGRASTWKE